MRLLLPKATAGVYTPPLRRLIDMLSQLLYIHNKNGGDTLEVGSLSHPESIGLIEPLWLRWHDSQGLSYRAYDVTKANLYEL